MKKTIITLAAIAGFASAPVLAQHGGHEMHGSHDKHGGQGQQAASDTADGEIKKIDKAAGKMTIKHGELKNLGMGAMTMVFKVKDAALLEKAKVGDKVRFTVDNSMTVTALDVSK